MNIDIGSKIKTLRLSKSMTQEQLAKALHVSAQAVSKWENGSSLPDIQLLPALSVTLGTSIDSLFSLTDESRFARTNWYAFTEFGQFLMMESEGRTQ